VSVTKSGWVTPPIVFDPLAFILNKGKLLIGTTPPLAYCTLTCVQTQMGPIDTSIPPQQTCGHQTDPTPGDVLASITIGLAISYWSLLLTLWFTTTVPDLVTLCTYPTAPMFTCTSLPQTHDPCQPYPFLVHYTLLFTSLTCNHTCHMAPLPLTINRPKPDSHTPQAHHHQGAVSYPCVTYILPSCGPTTYPKVTSNPPSSKVLPLEKPKHLPSSRRGRVWVPRHITHP